MSLRGRYAPSPTGELHLGNASTALLCWLSIRARAGCFVMRTEDLDGGRVREGLAEAIYADLRWLGLDWDEGPHVQSERREHYAEAFEQLRSAGHLYPCFCSRKDIAAAASAPQEPGEERLYPGSCRRIAPEKARRRIDGGDRHAWRFRVDTRASVEFDDLVQGPQVAAGAGQGDFVVSRADGVPAYQLAVVVDDAAMGIDEVVRGDDLLNSTARQLMLYRALGYEAPVFGHVPLLVGADGVRLSKRHAGTSVRDLREAGGSAEQLVGRLACLLGLRERATPVAAAELVSGFSLGQLRAASTRILCDPATW